MTSFWDVYSKWYGILDRFFPYREMIQDIVEVVPPEKEALVLDLGCGSGTLTIKLFKLRMNVIGFDYSSSMLNRAYKKSEISKAIGWVKGDMNKGVMFKDNVFDRVYSSNVLSYAQDPRFVVSEVHRMLKTKGLFILTNPHKKFSIFSLFLENLKKEGIGKTALILPPLLILGIMNGIIFFNVWKKRYIFFDYKQIEVLLKDLFTIIYAKKTYANQALLVVAEKI
jgi:ubiquinone/menaquinone biosynthesis C-methylase UbiE